MARRMTGVTAVVYYYYQYQHMHLYLFQLSCFLAGLRPLDSNIFYPPCSPS